MKNTIFISVLLAIVFSTLAAQALKKTEKISEEQVPLIVREAFEKDFGELPAEGFWTATFTVEQEGKRLIANPLSYTFHKKTRKEKIEVKYTAAGKLESFKGLERTAA